MNAPTRIGRYEIVRRLGKSMTDVYLANDIIEGRKVALKLVRTGGDSINRMIVEAERRGAAIQKELEALDPRVVKIYDYGEQEGYFYVAMQYVEGRNLAELLQAERAVDPVRAATIAIELCEQLAKFHSAQAAVVHGDVKPANIHIGPHDTVRLLDFGIAKTLRADHDSTAHDFGSPGYCSPERLERSEVDQQSDLWAVGATLYEMLSGAPPFQADNTRKLEAVIRSKRPPRALPPSVPRALRMVVAKALAPDAARRYRSAAAFEQDLHAYLERRPTVAENERRAGATIEAVLRKATHTVARARRRLQLAGAAGWFGLGMTLWIGGSYGWQLLEARPAIDPPKVPKPPQNLALLYRAEGDRAAQSSDWHTAELLLGRAVDLGETDAATLTALATAHAKNAPPPPVVVAAVEKKPVPPRIRRKRPTVRRRFRAATVKERLTR
jgi:eukaryotic-like serine/threonine-protein kinase